MFDDRRDEAYFESRLPIDGEERFDSVGFDYIFESLLDSMDSLLVDLAWFPPEDWITGPDDSQEASDPEVERQYLERMWDRGPYAP